MGIIIIRVHVRVENARVGRGAHGVERCWDIHRRSERLRLREQISGINLH